MTAEIGVFNPRGVALAADSAVTINRNKVVNSAVKLFTLDSAHYVGIMIYGNTDLQSVPWEVIIKSYREKLQNKAFDKLQDYVDDFKNYVSSLSIWNSRNAQWVMVSKYVITVVKTIEAALPKDKNFDKAIAEAEDLIPKDKVFDINGKNVIKNFGSEILRELKAEFPGITATQCTKCAMLIIRCLTSKYTPNDYTGVVFAGYGKSEMFPSIYKFQVDGIIDQCVKISGFEKATSNPLSVNERASIFTFAQSDVMRTVLCGIAPELNDFRRQQLGQLKANVISYIPEENQTAIELIFNQYDQLFEKRSQAEYMSPIISMLGNLSLNELGTMAEMLVNLTALKRKFTDDIGTVGGPVDVLTISKGEGPIWIKRKEYFNKDLNEGYRLRRK